MLPPEQSGRTEIASESCFASGVDHFLSLSKGLVVKFLSPRCARRSGAARMDRIPYMVVGVGDERLTRGERMRSTLQSLILRPTLESVRQRAYVPTRRFLS